MTNPPRRWSNVYQGLKFVQSTPLRFHGCLNSFINLIIDEHFTLKLARAGTLQMMSALCAGQHKTIPIAVACSLWVAPELITGVEINPDALEESGGPACDIYSLGIILYEMGSRDTPYGTDMTSPEDIMGQRLYSVL